jgi:hypothetical protein
VPRPALKPETKVWLQEQLHDDINEFRRFSGLKLKHWSV